MDIGQVMTTMRDPAGVPAPPQLFQLLMIATWIPHIAFVILTLGAATLSIYAFYFRVHDENWSRLGRAMTTVAKVGVSLLIVLGVAPLLFTQVIYDPQWYTSNVLSGRWAIGFIASLIVAYCLWFAFYGANHGHAKRWQGLYAVAALALFLLDGLIMHVLAMQAIEPQNWMQWYAPDGVVDPSGSQLHAIQWPRYLFIVALSAPAVGVFMIAYAQYFRVRPDVPASYLGFVAELGRVVAYRGFFASLPLLLWWNWEQPSALFWNPVPWFLVATVWLAARFARYEHGVDGYGQVGIGLAVLALLAVWREVVRATTLGGFGYHIADYKVNADWPSMLLFFSTLLGVGGAVGGFYLTLLYRAGRVEGTYQAEGEVARLGVGAIGVLALWITVFFAYGVSIYLQNILRP